MGPLRSIPYIILLTPTSGGEEPLHRKKIAMEQELPSLESSDGGNGPGNGNGNGHDDRIADFQGSITD